MPGFKIHISASSILGVGYGAGALIAYDVPLPACLLATGLCSVSGMLPDLDSGPGIPLRESLSFAAAFVPMMLFDRARQMHWDHETMVLAGAALYVLIRFGLGWFLREYSVHRGIYHSIPVCLIFAGLAFLLCNTGSLPLRYYKAGAVVVGFMSHLILDEIWSVERSGIGLNLKSSFGTAVKFYSPCWWSNALAYAALAVVSVAVLNDPIWADADPRAQKLHAIASDIVDDFDANVDQAKERLPPAARRARSIAAEVAGEVQDIANERSRPADEAQNFADERRPRADVQDPFPLPTPQDELQDSPDPPRASAAPIRRRIENRNRY